MDFLGLLHVYLNINSFIINFKSVITVIVPVYNVERYIARCIESVLAQTYTNFELLLINDGSSDLSPQICSSFALIDNRVHIFHKNNEGVGLARNYGIEKAKGTWLLFIDADDFVDAEYFQNIINAINNSLDVDGIVFPTWKDKPSFGSSILIDELSSQSGLYNIRDFYYQVSAFVKKSASIYSKVYNTNIIKKYHIRFRNTSVYEDSMFNLEYFQYTNKIYYVNKAYYHYMIYVGSPSLSRMTIRPYNDYVVTCLSMFKLINNSADKFGFDNKFKYILLSKCGQIMSMGFISIYKNGYSWLQKKQLVLEYSKIFQPYIKYIMSYKYKIFNIIVNNKVPFFIKDVILKLIICRY